MEITFWGVRGSIATAGGATAQVGGNTSCVQVRCGRTELVLDAGTGLRGLGVELARQPDVQVHLLVSHFHWDHMQGFPFFGPAYQPGRRISVYGPERCTGPGGDVRAMFDAQMRAPHFPVGLEAMRAKLSFRALPAGAEVRMGEARVRTAAARHPNGCLAYRVEHAGRSLVYATDTEHDAQSGVLDQELLELALGADVLIYDAQYTPEEYAGTAGGGPRRGWGHSTAEEGARIAAAAGVGQLILYHHDPAHDDWEVAQIEARTRARFTSSSAAREGMVIRLEAVAEAA